MDLAKNLESTFIGLLLTDIDVAITFLNVAATTQVGENAERNYRNAQRAYDQIVARVQAVTLTEEEQAVFEEKLGLLRSRLIAFRKPA